MLKVGVWKRIAKLVAISMSLCLTSSVVSFAAGPPPVITAQPSDATVLLNDSVTFSVAATSSTSLSYQWRKGGTNISGATQSTYTIAEAKPSMAGVYSVQLVNGGGSVISSNATLTVNTPPEITTSPKSQTIVKGQNASFTVVATGTSPLSYQWRLNNLPISGATGNALAVTNVQSSSAGNYQVVVSNYLGSVTSVVATLVLQDSVTRFNGSADDSDYVQAMAFDAQGNVYLTGYAKNNSAEYDCVTLKYDSSRNLLWRAVYNGPESKNDQANYLVIDQSGNVYVSGSSDGGSSTGSDYITIKYNSEGQQIWAKRYNGTASSDDYVRGLGVDTNGNVFVTGASKGSGSRYNYVTLKYDSEGNQVWLKRYVGSGNLEDQATALAMDAAGNVYVTGKSKGLLSGFDFCTLKYANSGTQLWESRYSGDLLKDDVASKITVDSSGNVFVAGYTSGLLGSIDYLTVKYNSSGVQQWAKTYNGSANRIDQPVDIAVDKEGNVLVTGSSETSAGNADYATLKYNTAGVQLWVNRYSGTSSSDDRASALAFDYSGDVYVTGSSRTSDFYDFATIKYSGASGSELWTSRFHSVNGVDDLAADMVVDNQFNVYVAGSAFDKADYTLLRYEAGPVAPSILAQPEGQAVSENQPVTLSVTVAGTGPLSYQWKRGNVALVNETNRTFSLSQAQVENSGSYTVTVTNSAGSVSSAAALITVTSYSSKLSAGNVTEMPKNGFTFQVSLNSGASCVVYASTDLISWLPIATNSITGTNISFIDPQATNLAARFYRVLVR